MTRLDLDPDLKNLDPDLERLGDALRASTAIELAREQRSDRTSSARRARPRRRVLAGSTLGLAGVGAVLVLALGGSTASPAFAITRSGDGAVVVNLKFYTAESIPEVNAKLTAMGVDEQILTTWQASGPAPVPGPVDCVPWRGMKVPGPPVRVLLGTNGTQVIGPGESPDNTGEGTFHIVHCFLIKTGATVPNNSGNTGNG